MLDNSNLEPAFDVSKMIEDELRPKHGSTSFRRLPKVQPMSEEPTKAKEPDILVERNKTHGDFGANARVSQAIKRIMRAELGWDMLTDTEREAMDMIALKFSRLLSGKALELQHWEDIVGYARLAENLAKHQPDV